MTFAFKPSLWDVALLRPDNQVKNYVERVNALKERVRSMVVDKRSKPEAKMVLIETLERLGVAYHFQQEIDKQIGQIFELKQGKLDDDYDLFTTSLHFRLFRMHGYNIPCSVFDKLKDGDETFKKALTKDVKGLLSLYEASHVRFHQEDVLKEANVFATLCLKHAMPVANSFLQERVARALSSNMHRSLPRLEARYYISAYEKEESKNELLLRFAKLNFNALQNLHKEEIIELKKWWKGLNLDSRLPYFRSRPVECYIWGGGNFDSWDSFPRLCGAKGLQFITLMNDTFDSYATIEDAKKFAEVLQQRWDIKKIDQLPEYMQIAYRAMVNTFEEFDREISKRERFYAVPYAREAIGRVADSYLKMLERLMGHNIPTFCKMTSNSLYQTGGHGTMTSYFMGMESATEDFFQWLMRDPRIIEASGQYVRYMNDIATYDREHEDGNFPNTSIDCYMKEYRVSREAAVAKLLELADETWWAMNQEWTSSTVPRELLTPVLNYARNAYVSYGKGLDRFSYPEKGLRDDIEALFIHPLKIE